MTRFILCTALLIAAAGPASAQRTIEYVEGAYELQLRDVELPTGAAGTLSFKTCADCSRTVLQASSATQYSLLNGTALALPEFLAMVAQLRETSAGNNGTGVGVFYDLKTKLVTRVILVPVSD